MVFRHLEDSLLTKLALGSGATTLGSLNHKLKSVGHRKFDTV